MAGRAVKASQPGAAAEARGDVASAAQRRAVGGRDEQMQGSRHGRGRAAATTEYSGTAVRRLASVLGIGRGAGRRRDSETSRASGDVCPAGGKGQRSAWQRGPPRGGRPRFSASNTGRPMDGSWLAVRVGGNCPCTLEWG